VPVNNSFPGAMFLDCGLEIKDDQLAGFKSFIKLMLAYNRQVNLTAITGEGEIWRKHVLDSLLIFWALEIPPAVRLIDVGTGAGIPGLILKIWRPDLRVTLLEAQQKKVKFLQRAVAELKLNEVECLWGRAEALGRDRRYREGFTIAVARGVAPLPVLAEYCLPLVTPEGTMVAYKGPAAMQELAAAAGAIKRLGGGAVRIWQKQLPGGDEQRNLIIIKKEKTTPAQYPRRPGLPAQQPLS
jgi:16S rRNA (guanine527-N7)-methyltransferase